MRNLVMVLFVVACSSSDDATTPIEMSCADMSQAVTIRHGTCRVTEGSDAISCASEGAYCGNEPDCPTDWQLACTESGPDAPPSTWTDCQYGLDSSGCMAGSDGTTYQAIETLDGVDGIAIHEMSDPSMCRFVPCQ